MKMLMGRRHVKYSCSEFKADMDNLEQEIKSTGKKYKWVYGLPRGGLIPAVVFSHRLKLKLLLTLKEKHVPEQTLIVDDISDTGKSLLKIPKIHRYDVATIYIKIDTKFVPKWHTRVAKKNEWIVYWWENS
jgi:hypothetical protein